MGLTRAPMMKEAQIGTKPAPGVMATRPTTRPVEAPTRVGFFSLITSSSIQGEHCACRRDAGGHEREPQGPSAASALPALNPNHPNHRIVAPRTTKGILWIRYAVCS